ncbi:NAD+--asparagine ADP-ribosyltransferase [Epilithonimonas hungarica]|jgi:YceI-like domain.|uniref:YceI family protein n=1 Tax=Epilithonimonas hungarica TaxID=454006 RepID=UPI0012D124B4|nr:YceI family protein [Epilithonimonas hungarica]MDP9956377.1 NAD+--asparagine ADP-ribosyltransferase [Epilithonimonas hungarica]MPT30268.1 YceI family protein [Chryseobacterium sp.]
MKLLYLLFGFMTLLANAQENFVKINGSTNVNKFQCVNNKFKNDGGVYTFSERNLPNIVLKVADFDCGNRMMTKDFQKILNAEKYPNMTIKFINFIKNQDGFNALVEVKMMNQSKRYNIEFDIENNKLIGRKNVKFSDFNITPPKKMGGMIVVKDDLDLIFSLATKI